MTKRIGFARIAAHAVVTALLIPLGSSATTIHESSLPGGDFANSASFPTILPDGTTEAQGTVYVFDIETSDSDAFAFTDLQPGSTFTASLFDLIGSCCGGSSTAAIARIFDESLNHLDTLVAGDDESTPELEFDSYVGTVPASGELRILVIPNEEQATYSFTLDAPRVVIPEPSTALLMSAGLSITAIWRRRQRRSDRILSSAP